MQHHCVVQPSLIHDRQILSYILRTINMNDMKLARELFLEAPKPTRQCCLKEGYYFAMRNCFY